ncbi:MAG TPA: hypothetical protein DGG94_03860 [Micromonosporaceae bacterium]|nr:hypothetical protein [Micromonosporaceae bacterium]HCU48935.1 hypothetical protein [Micromonosporaceae bacterium]
MLDHPAELFVFNRRGKVRRRLLIGVLVASLVSGMVMGVPPAAVGAEPASLSDMSVPVAPVAKGLATLPKMAPHTAARVVWPTPASAVMDVPTVVPARVGGLPIKVSRIVSGDDLSSRGLAGLAEPAPARVRIEVLDRGVAQRGGAPVAFRLSRADGGTGPAKVRIEVDYSGFRQAFGGVYASRLGLRLLPECGLAAVPREQALKGACAGVFLDSVNDFRSGVLSANIDLATPLAGLAGKPLSAKEQAMIGAESPVGARADVSAPQESMVVTLSASADARGVGTFGKTDLRESGTWLQTGASGNFSYNYPLATPPVPGSLSPKLSLDYSSATVDGQTAAEHVQNGPLGEGWSLAGGGFIESTFRPCVSDNSADHPATWTNATGDPCWRHENFQLSWSGRSGELVPTGTANVWKVAADDVARVEQVVASGHWKVTTTDGTQWFFGMQRLPGWTSGARETQSVLTQEMFANHSGEPCFHSSGYTYSHCTKAYRWNLDYVVDTRGNSMSYWYSRFDNLAGSNNSGQSTVSYHRDAVLERIEYGTRVGSETTITPAAVVEFTNSDRCVASDCSPNVNWPDTPWDLKCDVAPCNNNLSPSYWTTKRLTKITTKVWTGSGTDYKPVDEWTLGQSFPGGTDVPTLWLDSVTRKGFDAAGASITMPALTTHGRKDRNRADYDPNANMADPQKYRIDYLDTEAGGRIEVSYLPTNEPGDACTWWAGKSQSQWPNYNHNASRCFMQWTTNRQAPPEWSWWHKFVVNKITETDLVGGSPPVETAYTYTMDGASSNHPLVLWGYSSSVWASPNKAMSSWKGYPTVITTVGAAGGTQSKTKRVYYRGLDRDTGLDPGQEFWRQSSVVDSEGGSVTDHAALGGQVREEIVYDGASGPELSKTIHTPSVIATTAGGALPAWQTPPERYAYLTRNTSKKTYTKIADGSWRTTETVSTWNTTYGTLTQTNDLGQTSPVLDTDDVCTKYSYWMNITDHLINYPNKTETFGVSCGGDLTPKKLGEVRTYYDNQSTLNTPPVKGDPTKVETLKTYVCIPRRGGGCSSVSSTFIAENKVYDVWGRVTSAKDPLNRETVTVYTHNSAGLLSLAKTTTPAPVTGGTRFDTTTTFDVLRGLPLAVTDANGKVTSGGYDPLGRVTSVRQPGNTGTHPNVAYTYSITKTSWPYTETKTLGPNGNQISSFEMFDGRMRPRQTQTVTEDGKRTITDTRYDTRGLTAKTSIFYNSASAPNSTLVWPTNGDADIDRQTRYVYDGAGRKTFEQLYKADVKQFETNTNYEGDRSGVIPPTGGTVTQDLFDVRGRVVEKRQYQSATGFTGSFDKTAYTYDRLGRLKTVTDPGSNQWTYDYDLLGRQTKAVDPDAGISTTAHDDAGQVTETVDGNSNKLAYKYDGRKTEVREDTLTGTLRASWLYDTVAKGQLTSSSRYDGANTYTTAVGSYDDAYRPLSATQTIPGFAAGGGVLTYTVANAYKPNGAIATQTQPGVGGLPAETITHTYDNNGFAQTMTGTWSGGSQTYVADTEYKYDGLVSAQWLGAAGKQVKLSNSYFADTRRVSLSAVDIETTPGTFTTKYSTDYAYDNAGNITYAAGTTDSVRDQVECFKYDHLRRMTEAWTQAAIGTGCTTPQRTGADPYWRQWTFDTIGNRLTQKDIDPVAGNTDWTYDVGTTHGVKPHQIKNVNATGPLAGTPTRTFSYDTRGNTTTRTTETGAAQTLTWDKEGHPAAVQEGTNAVASYIYDSSGNRLIANTPSKSTLYLPDGTELEKIGTANPLGRRYYAGLAVRDAAGLKWICSNHQGTSTVQIDAVTLTANRRRFMPYGETRAAQPTWAGTKNYVGGTKDDTGLTHLGAREYDPNLGRFISADPIMDLNDPQQWHAYTYANSNPVTWKDPSGLIICGDDGCHQTATPKPGGGYIVTGEPQSYVAPCAPNCKPEKKPTTSQPTVIPAPTANGGPSSQPLGTPSPSGGQVPMPGYTPDMWCSQNPGKCDGEWEFVSYTPWVETPWIDSWWNTQDFSKNAAIVGLGLTGPAGAGLGAALGFLKEKSFQYRDRDKVERRWVGREDGHWEYRSTAEVTQVRTRHVISLPWGNEPFVSGWSDDTTYTSGS